MQRPLSFHRWIAVQLWMAFVATCLIFASTTEVGAESNDEKPIAIEVQERIFSGPQPGEQVRPFKVLGYKAGNAEEWEIVKPPDDSTTLICFVHKLSNDDRVLYGLGLVDFYVARHQSLTSHIVLLSDDREKMMAMLRGWTRGSLFTKSQLSLSLDGVEGPGSYGLNRKVAMTVVVAKGNKVVDNIVFQAPNGRDLQTIMASVAIALGEPEPNLANVQKELRAERQRRVEKKIKTSPVFQLAPNEQLGRIMYGMVHARGNRSKNAERLSQQLTAWVGDSDERKSTLRKYCQART